MLRRKYILLLGLLMFGIPKLTHAQVNFVTGSLTAQAAACPTSPGPSSSSTSALTISTVGYGGATFTLGSAAFSATVSFFGSGDGGTTWQPLNAVASNATSAVLLATATGVFQTNVSGYTNVCMVVTTFVSGTVTARIQLSTISARAGGGVSSGLPAGCTSPGAGQLTCTGAVIGQTIAASSASAQCLNLFVSAGYPAGNFAGFCAPASMSASLQWTLPGLDGGVMSSDNAQHLSFSGDANHSATVTIGSGADIAATSLCSTVNCPAGTYMVTVYIDMTTPCGTSGTFIPWLGYTDDSGARNGSSVTTFFPLNGVGAAPSTGTLTTTATANWGQATYMLRTTGVANNSLGSINYGATRTACGSAGPMVGKMYLNVVRVGN